ncbi:MAG: dual specificity protein phosphatase family protein [Desulfobacterales bacterium]|nr:dual specificity protein phosphatase family protein [Desulfobacterales bacterium]
MKIFIRCLSGVAILTIVILCLQCGYDNFHVVVKDRIYRSAQLTGDKLLKIISTKNIKTIINLRGIHKGDKWYEFEKAVAERNGVEHYSFKFNSRRLPNCIQLNGLIATLKQARRPLLLHCRGGSDRAGMASALALAIEKDAPLAELKRQFSLRYGVFPFSGSIGSRLFSQYEQWLSRTARVHTRNNLFFWTKNEYMDGDANLHYWIDSANGTFFKDSPSGYRCKLTAAPDLNSISIVGWAYDRRYSLPLEDLSLMIDDGPPLKIDFNISRADLVRHFALDPNDFPGSKVGWTATIDPRTLTEGCHGIYLLRTGSVGAKSWKVDTSFTLCIF